MRLCSLLRKLQQHRAEAAAFGSRTDTTAGEVRTRVKLASAGGHNPTLLFSEPRVALEIRVRPDVGDVLLAQPRAKACRDLVLVDERGDRARLLGPDRPPALRQGRAHPVPPRGRAAIASSTGRASTGVTGASGRRHGHDLDPVDVLGGGDDVARFDRRRRGHVEEIVQRHDVARVPSSTREACPSQRLVSRWPRAERAGEQPEPRPHG